MEIKDRYSEFKMGRGRTKILFKIIIIYFYKNLGWEEEGEFRGDTLTEIHSGLKVFATTTTTTTTNKQQQQEQNIKPH